MEHATEPLTPHQLRALHSNISGSRVKSRDGMSYVEGWDIKATLIRIFGYANFSSEIIDKKIVRQEQIPQSRDASKMNWAVSYEATVRLTIHQTGAVYAEAAIATNKQPDWGEAADTALKSAETDALKRAASFLGTQFGLSLYDSGRLIDIITTTLSPDQHDIIDDINTARANTPESQAAIARLQARIKVHDTTVTEVPTTVSEPTVTEVPVATLIASPVVTVTPPAVAVAKALENADREAARIDQAEATAAKKRRPTRKGTRNTEGAYGDDSARGRITADRRAIAAQALADAEQRVGLGDPYDEQNFAMDDERQIAEDSVR